MKSNLVILSILLALASGCKTAYQSDKITTVTTRTFGISVTTSSLTANNMPDIKLGFNTTVFQLVPTSTNGPVYTARTMNTIDVKQGLNPFGTGISEKIGTGDIKLGAGTNDTSYAIIPDTYHFFGAEKETVTNNVSK